MLRYLRLDVVKRIVHRHRLAALAFRPVAFGIPQIFRDTLLATELCDSPVDCNSSHDGNYSVFLLASVYIEDGLESTPHNPCFLFGAKLVYGSCKDRM